MADLVGLESSSALMRLLQTQAAQLLRPMALRVQMRSVEAVCRAVPARLGLGVLPMVAARSLVPATGRRVLPLTDLCALRRMLLVVRNHSTPHRGSVFATEGRSRSSAPDITSRVGWGGIQTASAKRKRK